MPQSREREAGDRRVQPVVDIVIPVYNEGDNILPALDSLRTALRYPARVLICFDHDDDNTLTALEGYDAAPIQLCFVKNQGRGVLGAVTTGLSRATAPCVITMPADDDYNAARLNEMIALTRDGYDIVTPSRFMPGGGGLVGCPFMKAMIVRVAGWFMWNIARLPTHDASNGFRVFNRRTIELIPIESDRGFAYSIELLVKAHRLGWRITERPVEWHQRKAGQSRFHIVRWLPQYLRWLMYALATTYLRRSASSVRLRGANEWVRANSA